MQMQILNLQTIQQLLQLFSSLSLYHILSPIQTGILHQQKKENPQLAIQKAPLSICTPNKSTVKTSAKHEFDLQHQDRELTQTLY
jgi:hypothetical protein